MKFGKRLETEALAKWLPYYINYKSLKKLIKAGLGPAEFSSAVEDQIAAAAAHFAREDANLRASEAEFAAAPPPALSAALARSRALGATSDDLLSFCELCYTAVYKIAKKYDKHRAASISAALLARLEREPFAARLVAQLAAPPAPPGGYHRAPSSSGVVAAFDGASARALAHASASLAAVAPGDADGSGAPFFLGERLGDVEAAVVRARAGLVAAVELGGAGVPAAALEARNAVFSALGRMLGRELAASSPEGVAGVEQMLQLHVAVYSEGAQGGSESSGGARPPAYSVGSGAALDGGDDGAGEGAPVLPSLPPLGRWPLLARAQRAARALAPAAFSWLPHYRWRKWLYRDVVAGVTIGVLLLPQGLAYATLAGLPAYRGLYTGFPPALYTLLGTSRHAAIGPQSIPALLIAEALSDIDDDAAYNNAVACVTTLVGALLLLAGWLRLGFVVRFISRPVLSGFAAGSALLTIAASLKDVLGVDIPRSPSLWEALRDAAGAVRGARPACVVATTLSLLALWALPRAPWSKALPAPLQVSAGAILLFFAWMKAAGLSGRFTPGPDAGPDAVDTFRGPFDIPIVGTITSALPAPALPAFSLGELPRLLRAAAAVALVGFIESAAVAQTYATQFGYEVSPASELKALGATNLLGGALGTIPVMGAFGRSSVNAAAGAATPLAQTVSAVTVVLLVVAVAPAVYYLPAPVLTAIIIKAVLGLIDVPLMRALWRGDKRDCACLLAAMAATAMLGVLYGVLLSVLISLALFVGTATRSKVEVLGRVRGSVVYAPAGETGVAPVRGGRALRFPGPLWFANAPALRDAVLRELRAREELPPRLRWRGVVVDCAGVSFVDSTAAGALEECAAAAHALRVPFLLAGLPRGTEASLRRLGVVEKLGGDVFLARSVHDGMVALCSLAVGPGDLPRGGGGSPASPQGSPVGARAGGLFRSAAASLCGARHSGEREPLLS